MKKSKLVIEKNIEIHFHKFFEACDKGSYGTDCSENCGHCRDVDDCFHVNGTCIRGCDAGYKGDLCKSRE